MLYIGIDLGTSAVKLLLVDSGGVIRRAVTKEYPLVFPRPGWSEQAPADWWDGCLAGLKELLEGSDPKQISGIGVGGQMHGLVILDAHDEVIRNAIHAAPHVLTAGYDPLNGIPLAAKTVCYSCVVQTEFLQPDD